MDTGSGNLNFLNKFEITGIAGKLVSWGVGEEVEVKGCRFKVKGIKVFPDNEIMLVGKPIQKKLDSLCNMIPDTPETFEESQHKIMDFVRGEKKKK